MAFDSIDSTWAATAATEGTLDALPLLHTLEGRDIT
jgi:hypothetical protein